MEAFDMSSGVAGRGGRVEFWAGMVPDPILGVFPEKGPALNVSAARAAQNQRCGCAPEIMRLGHQVADLVHGTSDEIYELKFGGRAHAGVRRSKVRPYNGRFVDRGRNPSSGPNAVAAG